MGSFLILAAAAAQLVRPAPSVPPAGGATGYATVRIMTAVEVGSGYAPPTGSYQTRSDMLRLVDGSTRPLLTYEFE